MEQGEEKEEKGEEQDANASRMKDRPLRMQGGRLELLLSKKTRSFS